MSSIVRRKRCLAVRSLQLGVPTVRIRRSPSNDARTRAARESRGRDTAVTLQNRDDADVALRAKNLSALDRPPRRLRCEIQRPCSRWQDEIPFGDRSSYYRRRMGAATSGGIAPVGKDRSIAKQWLHRDEAAERSAFLSRRVMAPPDQGRASESFRDAPGGLRIRSASPARSATALLPMEWRRTCRADQGRPARTSPSTVPARTAVSAVGRGGVGGTRSTSKLRRNSPSNGEKACCGC